MFDDIDFGSYRGPTIKGTTSSYLPSMRGTVCTYSRVAMIVAPGIKLAMSCVNILGRCCSSSAAALPAVLAASNVCLAVYF